MKLLPCWYVEICLSDYTHVAGVFFTEAEAEACIALAMWEGYERYIQEGKFATVDGSTGVLADSLVVTAGVVLEELESN